MLTNVTTVSMHASVEYTQDELRKRGKEKSDCAESNLNTDG